MIQIGETIPNLPLKIVTATGIQDVKTLDYLGTKRAVLFAVPGAFTPVCSSVHCAGYVERAAEIKQKLHIDEIICLAVNDAFVLNAWADTLNAKQNVTMMADGNGEFTHKLGLDLDARAFGLGIRSQRYSMVLLNGTVLSLNLEPSAGTCRISSADSLF